MMDFKRTRCVSAPGVGFLFAIGEPVQRALRERYAPVDPLAERLRSLVDFEVGKTAKGYDGRRIVAA